MENNGIFFFQHPQQTLFELDYFLSDNFVVSYSQDPHNGKNIWEPQPLFIMKLWMA